MKSIVYRLQSPGELRTETEWIDEDSIGAGHLLAETLYSAISPGTEVAAWLGLPPLRPSVVYPRLLGYCNLARVKKVGHGVKAIGVGDYILTHQCHRSSFSCSEKEVLASFKGSISDSLLRGLCTTYLFHLGYVALYEGSFFPGHRVAVIGAGTLGLATVVLARAFGSSPLLISGRSQGGALVGRSIDIGFSLKQDLFPRFESSFELVINTSNSWSDFQAATRLAAFKGTLVCLGFPGRGVELPAFNPLDSQYFYDKQLRISHCGYTPSKDFAAKGWQFTIETNMAFLSGLILNNRIDPDVLTLGVRPASELGSALADLADPEKRTGQTFVLSW